MSCGKEKDKNFRLCVCMYISITYFFFSWSHIWRAEILILFLQGAQVSHTQTVQGEGADTRGHDFRARHVLCHVVLSHVSFFLFFFFFFFSSAACLVSCGSFSCQFFFPASLACHVSCGSSLCNFCILAFFFNFPLFFSSQHVMCVLRFLLVSALCVFMCSNVCSIFIPHINTHTHTHTHDTHAHANVPTLTQVGALVLLRERAAVLHRFFFYYLFLLFRGPMYGVPPPRGISLSLPLSPSLSLCPPSPRMLQGSNMDVCWTSYSPPHGYWR